MVYLGVIVLLLFFIYRYDINDKKKYRNECFHIILFLFILIAGLRYRIGIDTPNYIVHFYHDYPTLDKLSWDDIFIGKDPLFVLINSIIKSFGGRFYIVQLIQSTFVNVLIFIYIRRHCSFIFTCLLLYSLTFYLTYNMDIMRASMSMALSFFANDFFIEKKWMKGYFLLVIGCFFHSQTVILFVLPFFLFLKLNLLGVIVLLGCFFIGQLLQSTLNDYIFLFEGNEMLSYKITEYLDSDVFGTRGGNFNFYISNIFPYIIYSIISLLYLKYKKKHAKCDILRLEPFLLFGLVFLLIQMNFQIAYRYVDFYKMYIVLFMAEAFGTWMKESDCLTKGLAFVRTYIFFIPYFVLINWTIFTHYEWFYPYSSILERNIDMHREYSFSEWDRPGWNPNEY